MMFSFPRAMPRLTFAHVGLLALLLSAFALPQAHMPAITSNMPSLHASPLSFFSNQGQTDSAVRMQARGMGGALAFLPNEVMLTLPADKQHAAVAIRLQFIGANPNPAIGGGERLPGVVNIYHGNDRATWQQNIPTFAALNYHELYNGVSLRYEGRDGRLKGTYTVAAGADPARIRWQYAGAKNIQLTASGDLEVTLSDGRQITEHAPVVWQEVGGQHVPVAARFSLEGQQVGFALGAYNASMPLIIDPELVYSTYLGGTDLDFGYDVAVDSQGNAVFVGSTGSIDFPVRNPIQSPQNSDAFITKLSPAGVILSSTFLGGSQNEEGLAVTTDAQGNAYVMGSTNSDDFPTLNPIQAQMNGGSDAFVTELGPDGTLAASTYFGGSGFENALHITSAETKGIALDPQGNVVISGDTNSPDLATAGAFQATLADVSDAYVAKLNLAEKRVVFATYLGGTGEDRANDVAIDSTGDIYITGTTSSDNFPVKDELSGQNGAGSGNTDAFVTKLSADGSALRYSTHLGGDGNQDGYAIAIDADRNAYVVGFTINSPDFPRVGTIRGLSGDGDAYFAKLDPSGRNLVYSTRFGGSGGTIAMDVKLGVDGSVYIAGGTDSPDFPTFNGVQNTVNGKSDAFVTRIAPRTCGVIASTLLGGSEGENGYNAGMAVDAQGYVYLAGSTVSNNFPTKNAAQATTGGSSDAFAARFQLGGPIGCFDTFLPLTAR